MLYLWTAFLLGLLGSVHCAGMCGPLALALPGAGEGRLSYSLGRGGYNLGRITAYALLGLGFGVVGKSISVAGFQRWASLLAGAFILLGLLPATRQGLSLPAVRAVALLKAAFASLLRRRSLTALYLLGVLNGFLPCGLVYAAGAGALTTGGVLAGVSYMAAFGAGTIPMMLGIGLLGRNVQLAVRSRFQTLIPVTLTLMGVLLIVRGLSLGIPYLSPDLSAAGGTPACH